MRALSVRSRLGLLSALLVAVVGTLVGVAGYVSLRDSLLGQARKQAREQAQQLAGLVDVPGSGVSGEQGNLVDISDPSLSHGFARGGLLVKVTRANGSRIQASRGGDALALGGGLGARCMSAGQATARQSSPAAAVACRRLGTAASPAGLVVVGAPLTDAYQSLARLRTGLAIGLGAGVLLAALASLFVAARALRPARRIAATAESIREGDLSRRIGYDGPSDELGALAHVLDACFAEMEQAIDRQRRFVADASHELKTPVAAIRAHTELLRGWAGAEPAARDAALSSLDQAARGAGRLVADLLYLSELDRRPPMVRLPVSVDELVVSVVHEAQPLRPDVPIRVAILDEAVVIGDPGRLQQLLLNLLDNALRVSPERGEVKVGLEAGGARATITVWDEGPGIPSEHLEQIFDRFYRSTGRPVRGGGAGLGLSIAREIARAHGGDLTAGNGASGAVLTITLPLEAVSSNSHSDVIELSSHGRSVAGANGNPTGGA